MAIHILSNIPRNRGNERTKFDWLIDMVVLARHCYGYLYFVKNWEIHVLQLLVSQIVRSKCLKF